LHRKQALIPCRSRPSALKSFNFLPARGQRQKLINFRARRIGAQFHAVRLWNRTGTENGTPAGAPEAGRGRQGSSPRPAHRRIVGILYSFLADPCRAQLMPTAATPSARPSVHVIETPQSFRRPAPQFFSAMGLQARPTAPWTTLRPHCAVCRLATGANERSILAWCRCSSRGTCRKILHISAYLWPGGKLSPLYQWVAFWHGRCL